MTTSPDILKKVSDAVTCAFAADFTRKMATIGLLTFRNGKAQAFVPIPGHVSPYEVLEPVASLVRELCADAMVLMIRHDLDDGAQLVRSVTYGDNQAVAIGLAVFRLAANNEVQADPSRSLSLIPVWAESACKPPYACLCEATSRAKAGKAPGAARWYRRAAQRLVDDFGCSVFIAGDEVYPWESEDKDRFDALLAEA